MDQLYPLLYKELRRRAHHHLLGHRPGETLGTTALVHELYLKLASGDAATYHDRVHFMAVASRAMRQIIIDDARRKLAAKRGRGVAVEPLESDRAARQEEHEAEGRALDLLALDEALERLTQVDERLARSVELRFFGELSIEDTAEVLGVSPRTVKRDWQKARAFLHDALGGATDPVAPPGS